jgi:hypothetical protein
VTVFEGVHRHHEAHRANAVDRDYHRAS